MIAVGMLTIVWICVGVVLKQIEQSETISRLTHMRLVTLMTALAAVDMTFVVICAMKVMDTGPSVFILFGFEVRGFYIV